MEQTLTFPLTETRIFSLCGYCRSAALHQRRQISSAEISMTTAQAEWALIKDATDLLNQREHLGCKCITAAGQMLLWVCVCVCVCEGVCVCESVWEWECECVCVCVCVFVHVMSLNTNDSSVWCSLEKKVPLKPQAASSSSWPSSSWPSSSWPSSSWPSPSWPSPSSAVLTIVSCILSQSLPVPEEFSHQWLHNNSQNGSPDYFDQYRDYNYLAGLFVDFKGQIVFSSFKCT